MTTPIFNINEIQVIGNKKVTKERIQSLSQISLNTNIFKYSKKDICKNIKEDPYVEKAIIKRKLPNKIVIDIQERTPEYIIKYGSSFVYINIQGYILEISNEELNLPIIEGYITNQNELIPGKRLNDEDLERLNTVIKIIESAKSNEIYNLITKINIQDKENYIIELEKQKKIVYLGDATNINDRILMLKEILIKEEKNAGEVFIKDLNKIYFRQYV